MGGGFGDSQPYEPPLCKGRWLPVGQTEGLCVTITAKYNPSVSYADSATGPVVQSSQSALTVPSARFTPHLRVALHFVQVPTGHALPSGALHRGAFAGGHSSRLPAKPLVTCLLSRLSAHAHSSRVVNRTNFSTHQPARTATIESDVKSLCPFSGRHKGRTV